MYHFTNRLIIFFILSTLMINNFPIESAILPIIINLAIICFLEYFENIKLSISIFLIYLLLCCFDFKFVYFLPIVLYDLSFTKYQCLSLIALIPILYNLKYINSKIFIILIMIFIIESVLKYNIEKSNNLNKTYHKQRDELIELSINLEKKVNELTIKQNEEINIAKLNERNRIAREIHDNVGHLLSSSLIQIGAIMTVTKDENTKKSLQLVKETLDNGMNSIRTSVHNLRDDSIDLYTQLKTLIDNFKFCDSKFNYELDTILSIQAKYAIIAITKEALSNIIKHSNATVVIVNLYEHPKIIQLIISDNGTVKSDINFTTGMGLEGIKQRVADLNGNINISNSNGFKIFISFNKEDVNEHNNC